MKQISRIYPLEVLGEDLLSIEKPARYLGGEYGSLPPGAKETDLILGLSFPDLYEIGMSNNAIRILYNEINARPGLRCERVFAPAPDFEALLKLRDVPLYTLEGGIPLADLDILGFTLGYELAATSILAILERGRIPRKRADRGGLDPLVIAGGPAISNPHPFGNFLDAAYIGEAEDSFFDLLGILQGIKLAGGGRDDYLEAMAKDGAFWFPLDSPWRRKPSQTKTQAKRAVFDAFGEATYHTATPVASIKTVQDHGTVEIMRGCPNGCRFCHAGYYYRPQRLKPYSIIRSEVEELVEKGGYREITLSSLSSGDYPGIEALLDALNSEFGGQGVSFQLPSLKISSFNLPLLEKLSEVRKSGLTFAVETPEDAWQRLINKDVSFEQTVSILEEAKKRGFKLAKFYFMIGLPVPGGLKAEAQSIIDFFGRLKSRIDIQLNVNLGNFVPKPHTPFQWAAQIGEEEALATIFAIKDGLKRWRGIKLSWHSPFVSTLEGIISRGDERVGDLIEAAFEKGARLDAWDEHFSRDLWRTVLEEAPWKPMEAIIREVSPEAELPWDDINIGVGKGYLKKELARAKALESTSACMDNCTEPCGACHDGGGIDRNIIQAEVGSRALTRPEPKPGRLLFAFSKDKRASYLPHLATVEALSRAFQIIGLPMQLSEGFNPMPRLELVQPLPLGVPSKAEVASILLRSNLGPRFQDPANGSLEGFLGAMNAVLPMGIHLHSAWLFTIEEGKKIHSLNGLAWGSGYSIKARTRSHDLDLASLKVGLEARLAELGIPRASLRSLEDDGLELLLPDTGRKEAGLMRMLETFIELRPVQSALDITRESCYAAADKAKQGPQRYEDVFASLELV